MCLSRSRESIWLMVALCGWPPLSRHTECVWVCVCVCRGGGDVCEDKEHGAGAYFCVCSAGVGRTCVVYWPVMCLSRFAACMLHLWSCVWLVYGDV